MRHDPLKEPTCILIQNPVTFLASNTTFIVRARYSLSLTLQRTETRNVSLRGRPLQVHPYDGLPVSRRDGFREGNLVRGAVRGLGQSQEASGGYGSDVDARDSAGYTALHYAARNGHLDTCRFLVDRGADVDAVTRAGKATALSRAALAGKHEVVEYLLSKKADPFVADVDGRTALHRAAENGHLAICECC
ncbi:hypothetical protein NQ318_020037 [Aromia moschata]|uniref:Uncharacterized protein n=1 Tax=Aromia moschata TaxID=1265417 RepID=A0AAV8ZBJ4_9CUCU|nr:hypothetical protein NQ318_020037 [Aromia moschata]